MALPPAEIEHGKTQLALDSPDRQVLDLMRPVGPELIPGIRVVATPGHSVGHASLVFENEGLRVVVAGDAAMTRDFFRHSDYYFNTVDPEAAVASIGTVADEADVVVPDHDNSFLTRRLE